MKRTFHRPAGGIGCVLLAVAAGLALLPACARKEPITEPVVTPGAPAVQGNRIVWSTDRPSRGSVRYGFAPGAYDHMAYPDAAGRRDRAHESDHSVALLDLRPGLRIYYQTVNEAPGAATAYSPPDSFVAGTPAAAGLLVSTMIHIGFGDSHLLTMPTTGKRILIDSGYRDAQVAVDTYLRTHGVTALDALLATHVHEDHLGGQVGAGGSDVDGVLGSYRPAVFLDSEEKSGISTAKPAYRELLRGLAALSIRSSILRRGQTSADTPDLAWDPRVHVLVLNSGVPPGYRPVDYEGTNINNESIVLRFTYGDVRFVIGGDAETECETSILAAFPAEQLEVAYYKMQHHGLRDASSAPWVNTLQPRVAFIPNTRLVWDPPNEFEGAIAAASARAAQAGAHVYAIDDAKPLGRPRGARQYNVSFVTDGASYEVRLEPATQSVPTVTAQQMGCVHEGASHALEHAGAAAR